LEIFFDLPYSIFGRIQNRSKDKESPHGRLVTFTSTGEKSPILRPKTKKGRYTALIVIKKGQGFPHIHEGSHNTDDEEIALCIEHSTTFIPQEGTLVVFDSRILCQDPTVEPNKSGYAMIWRYGSRLRDAILFHGQQRPKFV
jgi:hypothetical protein